MRIRCGYTIVIVVLKEGPELSKSIVALMGLSVPDNTAFIITKETKINPITDILLWYQ